MRIFALSKIDSDSKIIVAGEPGPYSANGTLEGWKDSIGRLVEGHALGAFAVAMAFVPPLLELIGEDGGGFNLKGPSSIGKTTLLRAAASVWGRGDQHGLIRTWRGTGNGVEGAATQFTDTLLPLDELGVASSYEVGNITYALAGGIGKQRAQKDGSAKPVNTWRVIVLSTGEIGIADKISEGGKKTRTGQEIRIIDVDADTGHGCGVFNQTDDAEELTENIRRAAITNFGTAGPAFVKAILNAGTDEVTAIVRAARDAFREKVAAGSRSGQVLRVANRLGLVAAAGELAIGLGIVPWRSGSVTEAVEKILDRWHAERGGNDPGEVRSAIAQIRLLLEQHGDSRFDKQNRNPGERPVPNRLGYLHGEGENRQWWIPPEIWKRNFCEGFDHRAVSRALVERGILLPDNEGKSSRIERVDGKATRVYVLTSKLTEE